MPKTQSPTKPPAHPPPPAALGADGEVRLGRHHHDSGHARVGSVRNLPAKYCTQLWQERHKGGKKATPSSSSSMFQSPSGRSLETADNSQRRQQKRGARKSFVDRLSAAQRWSTEKPARTSTETIRRASESSSRRPSRRDYSRHETRLGLPPSGSHTAATRMPRVASSSSSSSRSTGFSASFDDSRYWDFAFRATQRQDIGNQCRECKRPFSVLNEEIAVRRGGRIELRYHKECFSMVADPRSQPASSANVGKFVRSLQGTVAPNELYRKMRTRGHW